ncbi:MULTISPECIES: SUMF1/EgtB/PvdO family nonheme iron enzyme [unclassified Aminobacter]|uniref:SUMF1/EgtB/PvdO family nonheme iron enzyme n=1 Tax=unclassified Aminobacter TaxID=2644704 RepID=UPI000465DEB3|nr:MULTISPECIES: SUMF1/EgtB/PvdO family nonheme iron enzyme [unclassified Aminobacter]
MTDGGCRHQDGPTPAAVDLPVTGINYADATAYAAWLSERTGDDWRLPSDEEWSFAAAERFGDDALGLVEDDGSNPATRWLAAYRSRSAPDRSVAVRPRGHFGQNSKGLHDVSGSLWEWTTTCYARNRTDAAGRHAEATENCGVRVMGGRHRSYMSFFISDGKSGGCAAGMAPDNLGFRLVRDVKPGRAVAFVRRLLNRSTAG